MIRVKCLTQTYKYINGSKMTTEIAFSVAVAEDLHCFIYGFHLGISMYPMSHKDSVYQFFKN